MDAQQRVGGERRIDSHPEGAKAFGRRRRRALGEGDAHPARGRAAVVVADQEAADAPEGIADGQAGSCGVGHTQILDFLDEDDRAAGQEAADQPSVPDQTGPVEQQTDVVKEDRIVDLRSDDAADRGGHDDAGSEIVGQPVAAELEGEDPSAGHERHEHHQSKGGDLEAAEAKQGGPHRAKDTARDRKLGLSGPHNQGVLRSGVTRQVNRHGHTAMWHRHFCLCSLLERP